MPNLEKQAVAAAWALSKLNAQDWYNLCEGLVEASYGEGSRLYNRGRFDNAKLAGNALLNKPYNPNSKGDPFAGVDIGDLVFFSADDSNNDAGHVGLYIGDGKMVSARNGGVGVDNILQDPYWRARFRGTGDPPDTWRGNPDAVNDQQILAGAQALLNRANVGLNNPVTNPVQAELERQQAERQAQRNTLYQDVVRYQTAIERLEPGARNDLNPTYKTAKDALANADKLYRENEGKLQSISLDIAKEAQKDQAKPATTTGTVKEQGGKLWFFPSTGGTPKDITPEGWTGDPAAIKTVGGPGGAVFERQQDGTYKEVVAGKPDKPVTEVRDLGTSLAVMQDGKVVQRIPKDPAFDYVTRQDGSVVRYDKTGGPPVTVLQPLEPGYNRTAEQKGTEQTTLETARLTLQRLQAKRDSGLWSAEDAALLKDLEQKVQTGELNLAELTRKDAREQTRTDSGYYPRSDEADLATREQNTRTAATNQRTAELNQGKTELDLQREAQRADAGYYEADDAITLAQKQATYETALVDRDTKEFDLKRKQKVAELGRMVASGMSARDALTILGDFDKVLDDQYRHRQQDEVERYNKTTDEYRNRTAAESERSNKEGEAGNRDTENRNLMQLANQTASSAALGGIVGNLYRPFDPNRAATTVNPGGNPAMGVGTRLLQRLGIGHRGLPGGADPSNPYAGQAPGTVLPSAPAAFSAGPAIPQMPAAPVPAPMPVPAAPPIPAGLAGGQAPVTINVQTSQVPGAFR